MLFIGLCKQIPGTNLESSVRRLQWEWPADGPKIVAEYWLQTEDPTVIVAFEADSVGPMMMTIAAWSDVFEISIYPAVTAEEGMEMLQMMNPG
jgi:hypothetical protein